MFLTDIDSRAAIKGSRDPLGLVPLWSQFGRHVVGNLTTVSGSVRGFTSLLLGYHFSREVQDREGAAESTLSLFLKFEQLAAYCRWQVSKDGEFRGVERVKRNLSEGSVVHLSARTGEQILSNQKVYGLWGLFSGPARASGLLEREESVLTPQAQAFVGGQYIAFLSKEGFKDGREVVELLRQERADVQLIGRHAGLARAIARIHQSNYSALERGFYHEHLVLGGRSNQTGGLQEQLAELMGNLPSGTPFDRRQLRALKKEGWHRGKAWAPLADRLERIDLLEGVLVPAEAAFGVLLARHGQKPEDVSRELAKAWGPLGFVDAEALQALRAEVGEAFHEPTAGERWVRIAGALAEGEYEELLRLLLEHNAFVMQSRNGSTPWVRMASGRLDVRFRDEASRLPGKEELPDLWRNNYFLNPLKDVMGMLAKA